MFFSSLHVFLPVHNRGGLTADFIRHLNRQIKDQLPCQFWILDDGCSDETIELALRVVPTAYVISLGGSAYWGGALNSIRDIIVDRFRNGFTRECYLVCNDDIRLVKGAVQAALQALTTRRVVCSLARVLPHNEFLSLDLPDFSPHMPPAMHRFDPLSGQFVAESDPSRVNVASTYAMLTTYDPWISVDSIPDSIPHYLSDWWLTYSFSRNNFSILHPPGFFCYTSDLTTNNHSETSSFGMASGSVLRLFWLVCRHCVQSASLKSPSYAPAWIIFLKKYSAERRLFNRLLKLRLAFALGFILKFFPPLSK
jgi:GT2 family glycosyltransferase